MYCTNCGADLEKTDKFCFHCGIAQRERVIADRQRLLEPSVYTPQGQIVSDEELELFIGKNAASYLNKWRQASHWNWPPLYLDKIGCCTEACTCTSSSTCSLRQRSLGSQR
ncbi:zinc ribbon domain-containing protein [Paenibacillus lutimineralis]|uniref:Zinc ribbon domain-containing protein n=1 Tax=Paenibacillus lutimineralis TaxID=2707005 RepID=A0A3Q9I654_9BACL|nr:zinc ribbon domain-containing protein [Paenibacillus lutimineralis]